MGRTMPTNCPHGGIADWGGFGDDWEPYRGLCAECVPPETVGEMTAEYRDWNRDWLEEFHGDWYAQRDAICRWNREHVATVVDEEFGLRIGGMACEHPSLTGDRCDACGWKADR